MYSYDKSKYTQRIRLTEEDLAWIRENKGKKSAAGFLEQLIKQAREGKKK